MATAIQIQLTLDASGAITGVQQFGQSVSKIQPPSPKIKDEFKGIEESEMRAHIAGTLVARTTGVEIPRALEQVIARSKVLGPLLSSMFDVSVFAAAGVGIVAFAKTAIDGISAFSDAIMGNTAEIKAMGDAAIKASQDAFWSPKNYGVAIQHITQINQAVEQLRKAPSLYSQLSGSVLGAAAAAGNPESQLGIDKQLQQIDQNRIQLLERMTELGAARNALLDQENAKANEAGKQGFALLAQQEQDYKQSSAYYTLLREAASTTTAEALTAQQLLSDHDKEYAGQRLALEREVTDQTIALRHQVDEAAVQGIARINVQEQDSIADINRRRQESLITEQAAMQQRALIHKRTSDQIIQFQRQENIETIALQDQARDAALNGDDLIYAHQEEMVTKQRELYLQGLIDFETYQTRVQAIDQLTQNQILANHRETARELGNLQEQQRDAESAVALSYVEDWQKANAQALIERDKQLRLIDQQERELLVKYAGDQDMIQQITETEQARRAAVWAQTDETIRNQHKQLVEQLGSDLTSVFDDIASGNIGQRILKNIEALFAQIVAQWILSLGIMKTTFGGLFGSIVFGPGSTGSNVFGGGSLLSGLFGGTSSSGTSVPGTAAGASLSSLAGLTSTTGTSALSSAIAGTSANSGAFSASGALTSQSLSSITSADGAIAAGGFQPSKSSSGGILSGLFSGKGLSSLSTMGVMLASALGGKVGQVGGLLTAGAFALGPALLAHLGLAALAPVILGPLALAGGGLIGFGLGQQMGTGLGALGGAGAGALTGFMVGGPIGAAVGAAIGLLGGIFGGIFGGNKRKKQANSYVDGTIVPDIKQITDGFDNFQLDSASALQQLENLRDDAQKQLSGLKSQGNDVFKNRVDPAIDDAEKHINDIETQREQRAAMVFGPAQFHDGGIVDVMKASIRRKPDEMLAVLKHGEFVMNPLATSRNRGSLEAMNAGGVGGGNLGAPVLVFNAMDAASFQAWAKKGGAVEISKALNRLMTEGKW